jgi:hypothetical protein
MVKKAARRRVSPSVGGAGAGQAAVRAEDGEAIVVGVGVGSSVVGAGVLAGALAGGGVAEAEGAGGLLGRVVVTVAGGVAGEELGGAVLAAGDVLVVPGRLLAGTGIRDGDGTAGTIRGAR